MANMMVLFENSRDHSAESSAFRQKERAEILAAQTEFPDTTPLTHPKLQLGDITGFERLHYWSRAELAPMLRNLMLLTRLEGYATPQWRTEQVQATLRLGARLFQLITVALEDGPQAAIYLDRDRTDKVKAVKDARKRARLEDELNASKRSRIPSTCNLSATYASFSVAY